LSHGPSLGETLELGWATLFCGSADLHFKF
jgi:hypothetical protein